MLGIISATYEPIPPVVVTVDMLPAATPRQFRQALTLAGKRAMVEAAVAASDQDTRDWYNYATQFERRHPKVESMAAALGIAPAEVDAVFTLAVTL